MTDNEGDKSPDKLRWRWLAICIVVGIALLWLAIQGQTWWQWQGVWPGIVVNVGTGFLLAAVLFLFERRFTSRVVKAGQEAIQQAAEQVEERLQQRADELTARIDDLQAQVEQRMRARAQETDLVIAALGEDVSYATITAALTEANRLRAINWGRVTVQAAADPDGVALTFKWGEESDGSFAWRGLGPRLQLEARIEADFEISGRRPYIAVQWKPTDSATDMAEHLNHELQAAGRWHGPDRLDWSLALRNLQRSLDLAIASRRDGSAAGPWCLHGALYELVGEDWAITEAGIENRPLNQVILGEADFPASDARPWGAPVEEWPPARPDWVDEGDWERLLRRGRRLFPRGRGPLASQPTWRPWTEPIGDRPGTGT